MEREARLLWKEIAIELTPIYGESEAESIAAILLEDIYGVKKIDLLSGSLISYDNDEFNALIERLKFNEPVQYVTGKAPFYGRFFRVKPGVLIPRPETEELVGLILEMNGNAKSKILEVGVGSGCIAITLALEFEGQVFGTDISQEALNIAEKNAELHGAQIKLMRHDVLTEQLPESDLDILVSNPPYIPLKEQRQMQENVTSFEPGEALFVPSEDPLIFYHKISGAGKRSLKSGGRLFFEIHESFGVQVSNLLAEQGYSEVAIHKDFQGKDRMISATNSTNK